MEETNALQLITSFFAGIWDLFTQIQVPLLGITFAQLWIGVFVVGFTITILRPILGIGAGAVNSVSRGISSAGRSLRRYRGVKHDSDN